MSSIQQQAAEPVLSLTLAVSEINYVLGLVGKQPYDQSAVLIHKIQAQCAPQLASLRPPAPPEVPAA